MRNTVVGGSLWKASMALARCGCAMEPLMVRCWKPSAGSLEGDGGGGGALGGCLRLARGAAVHVLLLLLLLRRRAWCRWALPQLIAGPAAPTCAAAS
jgi:hypothetical protein